MVDGISLPGAKTAWLAALGIIWDQARGRALNYRATMLNEENGISFQSAMYRRPSVLDAASPNTFFWLFFTAQVQYSLLHVRTRIISALLYDSAKVAQMTMGARPACPDSCCCCCVAIQITFVTKEHGKGMTMPKTNSFFTCLHKILFSSPSFHQLHYGLAGFLYNSEEESQKKQLCRYRDLLLI